MSVGQRRHFNLILPVFFSAQPVLSAAGVVLAICDRTDHLRILADENSTKRTQIE